MVFERIRISKIMKRPYDVNFVADYVILSLNSDERFSLINLKLQKIMYYIQAWSLGINGEPMMNAKFEAWVHGPVCIELYDRFKENKNLYSFIEKDDVLDSDSPSKIDFKDIEFIDYILENYAQYSGVQIEAMTHSEDPWINARKGFKPMERCHNEITEQAMKDYYGKKYASLQA